MTAAPNETMKNTPVKMAVFWSSGAAERSMLCGVTWQRYVCARTGQARRRGSWAPRDPLQRYGHSGGRRQRSKQSLSSLAEPRGSSTCQNLCATALTSRIWAQY